MPVIYNFLINIINKKLIKVTNLADELYYLSLVSLIALP